MDNEVLFLVKDQDGKIVSSASPEPDLELGSIERSARFVKGMADLSACRLLSDSMGLPSY